MAVIENFADYPAKQEIEKQRIVFDLLQQGLNDVAVIDKLDLQILSETLDEVKNSIK
jgi:hypothetical protein